MTLERGTLLNNRYRIIEILGQGGMASIYRAIDENLGVDVAVKENLFTTEEYARQFRLEAVILANLRHPNMPRVTDHFVIEGQGQYLVMDYIEGEDLRQRLDRLGPLPEEEVIVLGVAICEALTYLHSRTPSVLHRDVKPGNVKITPQGQIFLVDFGLAKVVQRGQATTTGARAMTPGYSPPEQYGTARTDPRTDIYSLGATLYSALSDTLPEDGLARAMEQTTLTPIRQRNQKVSKRLAAVIEKSLEVRPDNRYQNAEEFKQCLLSARSTTRRKIPVDLTLSPPPAGENEEGDAESGSQDSQEPSGENQSDLPVVIDSRLSNNPDKEYRPRRKRKSSRPWLVLATLFGLIFTGGFAAYVINPALLMGAMSWLPLSSTPASTATLFVASSHTPVVTVDVTHTATLEPEPSATSTQESTALPTHTPRPTNTPPPTATFTATPVPTTQGGGLAQIAFASDRTGVPEIYLTDLDGAEWVQITDIPEGACQPSWSPDGTRLVFISPCKEDQELYRGSSMFLMDADGTHVLPLPSAPGGDFDPAWSPDGKTIAFASMRQTEYPQIYLLDLATSEVTMLPDPNNKANSQPSWSPDGKQLAYVGPRVQIWVMDVSGENRYLLGRGSENLSRSPSWSPDGQVVALTQWQEGFYGFPWLSKVQVVEGGSLVAELPHEFGMADARYSPDGYWLVFHSWPDGENHDIYIMNPSGVSREQITSDPANEFDPVWRPGS